MASRPGLGTDKDNGIQILRSMLMLIHCTDAEAGIADIDNDADADIDTDLSNQKKYLKGSTMQLW